MDGKDKNTKKGADTPAETAKFACKAHLKVIACIFVLVIILLYTFWNMMESKITETVAKERVSFVSDLASLDARFVSIDTRFAALDDRLVEAGKETIDIDLVKADVEAIKKAGEDFERRLAAVIKAEELKLAEYEKDVLNQKAYIDELKNLLESR